jgi:HSP20 family protein
MVELAPKGELRRTIHRPIEEMHFMEAGPAHWRLTVRLPAWRPPTDVYETEEAIVVRVEVAGMKEEDFNIELDGRYLLVRGSRPDIPERRAYHQMEIRFGEFGVEVEMPAAIIAERVEAIYQDGFLRITLPKEAPHRVDIAE